MPVGVGKDGTTIWRERETTPPVHVGTSQYSPEECDINRATDLAGYFKRVNLNQLNPYVEALNILGQVDNDSTRALRITQNLRDSVSNSKAFFDSVDYEINQYTS